MTSVWLKHENGKALLVGLVEGKLDLRDLSARLNLELKSLQTGEVALVADELGICRSGIAEIKELALQTGGGDGSKENPLIISDLKHSSSVQTSVAVPTVDETLDRDAFFSPYEGSDLPLRYLLSKLDKFTDLWDPVIYHSPYTSMVQSSGWGKSRLIAELATKGVFVIYCSFMPDDARGFPRGTGNVCIFGSGFTEKKGVAYLVASLRVLAASKCSPVEWMNKQLIQQEDVSGSVCAEYCKVLRTGAASDASLKDAVDAVPSFRAAGVKVVFAFDEAKSMMPALIDMLRRSLRWFPRHSRCFAIVSDTCSGKFSKFSPLYKRDPTLKVPREGYKLFPPVCLVSGSDIFLGKRKPGTDPMAPVNLFALGRPMWGALIQKGMGVDALVDFVIEKMLCGLEGIGAKIKEVTHALAASCFAISAGTTVVPGGPLVGEMVASHMATLLWVSQDRGLLRTAPTSEAVLGEAVARLFWKYGYFEPCLRMLAGLCDDGLVFEAVRGDLVARIIFCTAMAAAAKASGAEFYTTPVSVEAFFEALLGKEAAAKVKSNAGITFMGSVCFNHFLPMTGTHSPNTKKKKKKKRITYTYVGKDKLKWFYEHAAAFRFPEGEWAAEFGTPVALPGGNFSLIDVLVKNWESVTYPAERREVLANHGGSDSIVLVMCFNAGKPFVEVKGREVVVVGGPDMYPAATMYNAALHQILKSSANVHPDRLYKDVELQLARSLLSYC